MVVLLTPLKKNLLILYLGSFLLTSVLEFITGFVMEKVFHNKWWDYSDKPFNIMGYVCLKFSIFWGLACTFIMLIIHPIIYGFIHLIPHIIQLYTRIASGKIHKGFSTFSAFLGIIYSKKHTLYRKSDEYTFLSRKQPYFF